MGDEGQTVAGQLAGRTEFMKLFLVVPLSLLILLSSGKAEARSLIERLDHFIWGRGSALDSAFDAYDSGKFEEASKALQSFATSQPSQVASYNAGVAAYKAGHPDDAMKAWERASAGNGLDPLLKAKALHNLALVKIEKKELEAARDSLKEALSFDNDNKPIRENLEWVEEQLKQKNPDQQQKDEKKDQNQDSKQPDQEKKDQDQQKQDQNQNQADKDKDKEKQQKDQDSKSAEQKGENKDNKDQDSKSQDQKSAEEKQKEDQAKKDQQSASGKPKDEKDKKPEGKDEKSMAEQQKAKEQDQSKDKGQDEKAMSASQEQQAANKDKEGQVIMTPAELKSQEAERLLRTIDDKIGRYPLTDTEATGKRGADGKNW